MLASPSIQHSYSQLIRYYQYQSYPQDNPNIFPKHMSQTYFQKIFPTCSEKTNIPTMCMCVYIYTHIIWYIYIYTHVLIPWYPLHFAAPGALQLLLQPPTWAPCCSSPLRRLRRGDRKNTHTSFSWIYFSIFCLGMLFGIYIYISMKNADSMDFRFLATDWG